MIRESNQLIKQKIEENKPFIISRIGLGPETRAIIRSLNNKIVFKNFENAGIYFKTKEDANIYYDMNKKCFENSDFLAAFQDVWKREQFFIMKKFNLKQLHSRVIEPFYLCLENQEPWTLKLYGKKILIVNPFVESFKKQLENGFKFFKDKDIFHPEQDFVFYKSYQTSGGNHLHTSWLESFNLMKEDIRKLDFDFALLGCGGYGLPLCNFIKEDLGKSAIYVGGGLQLLFGVKGKRWESHSLIGKLIRDNGNFISPSGCEIMKNKNRIEGGCYW